MEKWAFICNYKGILAQGDEAKALFDDKESENVYLFAVWARYQPLLNVFNLCLSKIPWQSLVCVVQVVGRTDEGECDSL